MARRTRTWWARIRTAISNFFAGLTDSSVADEVDRKHGRMHPAQTHRGRYMGGTGAGF